MWGLFNLIDPLLSPYSAFPYEALLYFYPLWNSHPSTFFFGWFFSTVIFLSFLFSFMRNLPNILLLSLWSHLPSSIPCGERMLWLPNACNPPKQCWQFSSQSIFHCTTQSQSCLQQPWIWFSHRTPKSCLTAQRCPPRWQFSCRQLISEKLFVLTLKNWWKQGGKLCIRDFLPGLDMVQ